LNKEDAMNAELLHTFATWAWHTSIEALPLAIAALIFWRWMPVAWRWWLPALFFVRLAMPQVPETNWHWCAAIDRSQPAPVVESAGDSATNVAPISASRPSPLARVVPVLPIVWSAGVLLVAGWLTLSHGRLRRVMRMGVVDDTLQAHGDWAAARMSIARRVPVCVIHGLSTMAVSGWIRPVLLVPDDVVHRFTVAQIRGMMLHEMAHVSRRDVLWTWLALALCTLHWFNPLAWLALRRFHADRELACDAAALRALDQSARRDYGEALLLCLRSSPVTHAPALVPFFRHFSELKQRLQHIMKPVSPSITTRLAISLAVPFLVAITFTTARAQTRDGDISKAAPRDGAQEKAGPRDGEAKKEGPRDGEARKDGEPRKEGARDGEAKKEGRRDGEVRKDGEPRREGARDGDVKKEGRRDGEARKDGEPRKEGARDGDARKDGPRDGEAKKDGPRDGEARKDAPRDGDAKKEGARDQG
jgi:beta-lactamase regulating signal transducer with metallopeptidase domain